MNNKEINKYIKSKSRFENKSNDPVRKKSYLAAPTILFSLVDSGLLTESESFAYLNIMRNSYRDSGCFTRPSLTAESDCRFNDHVTKRDFTKILEKLKSLGLVEYYDYGWKVGITCMLTEDTCGFWPWPRVKGVSEHMIQDDAKIRFSIGERDLPEIRENDE